MLELQQVSLQYLNKDKTPMWALREFSLQVEQGARLSVVGPSGCGKSSLLYLLAGLKFPTEGKVLFHGEPVDGPKTRTSLILQDYGLFPWKTVYDNIALGLKLSGKDRAVMDRKVKDTAEELGIGEKLAQYPGELSGGQRQRVAIARGLVQDPEILLMDEPFGALDTLTQEKMDEMLLNLCKGKGLTLVMVTHNIEEAVFLGEKIAVFGQIPGVLETVLDNEGSGTSGYRDSETFYKKCSEVRARLGGSHEK
ncbi:MAG: ABC transporter ATP-binding protein [Clostridiales bacterium]|nr:ABC transporter ATP-binding protein [Clostridiales bacterium]